MPRKFYKLKLLLDEGFHLRANFPTLNQRFDVKHIKTDLKQAGLSDLEVYKLALRQKRLVATLNEKDFRSLVEISKQTGVIGVSSNLSDDQIDKKLTSLLSKSAKTSLYGKLTLIPGSSEDA